MTTMSSTQLFTPRVHHVLVLLCLLISTDGFSTSFVRNGEFVLSQCSRVGCITRQSFREEAKLCSALCTTHNDIGEIRRQRLFHAKSATSSPSSKLQMTTAGSSNDVSNNSNNPFIKVWLWFRKMLAKIWSFLKKPFQQKDSRKDVATDTEPNKVGTEKGEVIQTQMDNLAAVEDETKTELSELLANAENGDVGVSEQRKTPTHMEETTTAPTQTKTKASLPRQATACPTVDLSGNWTLIVDDAFKSQYDDYLKKLGQPMLVRTVALTVIGSTKEETKQMDGGQQLYIKGTNVRGSWERTLEASETNTDGKTTDHAVEGHVLKPMITADDEEVEVASWWEENGTVHKSWVVGGKKYGGGDFENRRYLTDNGNILVCESIFHPIESGRPKASVTWRFLKEGAMYGEEEFHFPNPFEVFDKKEEAAPADKVSSIVVGEIMDSVATSDEVNKLSPSVDVEKYIDEEGWVPPAGERWALAAPGVDLTGKWKLIITEQFKEDYAEFLKSLGQPAIVIGAAVLLVGNTREETKQFDGGRSLYIRGINTKGIWERTLIASGSDFDKVMAPQSDGTYNHTQVPIVTADSEKVLAESWWENDGTVHVSWTLGVKKYGGGSFESKRYLENNGDVYVCESTFHPDDSERREKSQLAWRFLREGATIFLKS